MIGKRRPESSVQVHEESTMGRYTMTATIPLPYADAVPATRAALADEGFGVLTEIDLAATLRAKLGVEITPQVILGACRPPLAYEALRADPSVAALLPCNVVVRAVDEQTCVVEAFDPDAMSALADAGAFEAVAADAKRRLSAVLVGLGDLSREDWIASPGGCVP
jgi:uncharacterized protein (DUF302 family)